MKELPYNPQLKSVARKLRKAGILHEAIFWNEIKSKKLNGLDFDRQKIIGNYIADFYCDEKRVIVEIDGVSHNEKYEYDKQRLEFFGSLGLEIIILSTTDILQNLSGVIYCLKNLPILQP
jgi:very-short-patch-repair endonuclease